MSDHGTVGQSIKDYPLFQGVQSILEFGSADGNTYKVVQPERYLGIDIEPTWMGDGKAVVEKIDLYYWRPTGEKFDLVICDAHKAADDPDLQNITLMQGVVATLCAKKRGLIVVDDCWYQEVADGAIRALGEPNYKHPVRTGLWIWRA